MMLNFTTHTCVTGIKLIIKHSQGLEVKKETGDLRSCGKITDCILYRVCYYVYKVLR